NQMFAWTWERTVTKFASPVTAPADSLCPGHRLNRKSGWPRGEGRIGLTEMPHSLLDGAENPHSLADAVVSPNRRMSGGGGQMSGQICRFSKKIRLFCRSRSGRTTKR